MVAQMSILFLHFLKMGVLLPQSLHFWKKPFRTTRKFLEIFRQGEEAIVVLFPPAMTPLI